ncbi:gamma-glutamylcyclotransferase family protein [Clostridium sp.]|uniref:gamma-glutamylcyclotransferase family protein n=1 Tax=Clostridium sp. TaxID=1506 RepID=UPI003D6D46A1
MVDKFGSGLEEYITKIKEAVDELSEAIVVFVYGTLMSGNNNNEMFLSETKFAGDFIAEGFELYDLGNYPGIIHSENNKVKGQLYVINKNILNNLDILEGEGSLYIRELIRVVNDKNESREAYTYVYNQDISGKVKVSYEDQPWRVVKEVF